MSITENEINWITKNSKPRQKAFYTIMRQSGLKPNTIKQLKIKHTEKIRDPEPPIPCKIDVPNELEKTKFGRHPSFIAEEAIRYLKKYLIKRELQEKEQLTDESLLFTIHNKPNRQIDIKEINRTFKRTAKKIGIKKQLELSDLRDFFKQKSKEMKYNHVNYLIGNTTESNYTPENDDFYRKLYKEIIMDSIEIEPLEKSALYSRDNQIKKIKNQLKTIEPLLEWVNVLKKSGQLEYFLDKVKNAEAIQLPPDEGSFRKIDLPDEVCLKIDEIAERTGKKKGEVMNEAFETGIDILMTTAKNRKQRAHVKNKTNKIQTRKNAIKKN